MRIRHVLAAGIALGLFLCSQTIALGWSSDEIREAKPATEAKSASASEIRISWEETDCAAGYQIWRSESERGRYKKVASVPRDETHYTDTGLECGKKYFYKVRGYRRTGGELCYTKFSEPVSSKPVPGKVRGLNVKGEAGNLIYLKLKWNRIDGASGYEEQVRTMKNGKWSEWKNCAISADGKLSCMEDYDDVLRRAKIAFPDGKVTTVKQVDGRKVITLQSVKEYVSGIMGKTEARIAADQSEDIRYAFRVRAYKKVNGRKIYGPWSETFFLRETLNTEKLAEDVENYILEKNPDFQLYGEEDRLGVTPENGSYFIEGAFGALSRYVSQKDALDYLCYCFDTYSHDRGFLYIRKQNPGDREGLSISDSSCYMAWLLY